MKAKDKPVEIKPDKLCSICGRVLWGAWQVLPFDKGRHEDCAIGSEEWLEHFNALAKEDKAQLAEFHGFQYGEDKAPCENSKPL